ncbi:hypothetical protein L195_g029714 [Trifolium pratense]|uniref:Gag-pol polyprotein n=1 Tax=Trifolium pratense TaxID=57577 RepID=A0A2K3L5J9_TRIPR|nr:hypothetical protein L195_g029714 [Trifolium pratense]
MKTCGETISNRMIIKKLMHTLSPQFDHIVMAIEESSAFRSLKIEDLQGSSKAHELRLVDKKCVKDSIKALQAQIFKKCGANDRFKGKKDEGKNKKSPIYRNPK